MNKVDCQHKRRSICKGGIKHTKTMIVYASVVQTLARGPLVARRQLLCDPRTLSVWDILHKVINTLYGHTANASHTLLKCRSLCNY